MIQTGVSFVQKYVQNGKIIPNDTNIIYGDLNLSHLNILVIENLPKVITGTLNLSYNDIYKIENIPDTLFESTKINDLSNMIDLSHNFITKIENLPRNIQSLDLSHNYISKIENLPTGLSTYLCLDHNEISKIENIDNEFIFDISMKENGIIDQDIVNVDFSSFRFDNCIFTDKKYFRKYQLDFVRKRNLERINKL